MSMPAKHHPTKCIICEREFNSPRNLGIHIAATHKMCAKEYYDIHLKEELEEQCLTCGSPAKFYGLVKGYAICCSRRCSNQNTEFAKQRGDSTSLAYKNDPTIMKKIQAKRAKTYENHPEIRTKALMKYKETHKANPDIRLSAARKAAETMRMTPGALERAVAKTKATLAANSDIQANAIKKFKKTIQSNPDILKNRSIKTAETHRSNPQIRIDTIEKMKHTLSTPEAKAMMSRRGSINMRNFHNDLQRNSSTKECSVYLVAHESLGIVKIGITVNMDARIGELRRTFGQANIVKELKTTYDKAVDLEMKMHKHFHDYVNVLPAGAGRTEFFLDVITDEAITMLEEFKSSMKV